MKIFQIYPWRIIKYCLIGIIGLIVIINIIQDNSMIEMEGMREHPGGVFHIHFIKERRKRNVYHGNERNYASV